MFPRRGRVSPEQRDVWLHEQAGVAAAVRVEPLARVPCVVAGADCAFDGDDVVAVAVTWDRVAGEVVETRAVRMRNDVPYVPGFLSFREGPAVLAAVDRLETPFGLLMIDGQGVAHPRRCGIACHVGVMRDVPCVGVAKSRLIGTHGSVGIGAGDEVDLVHQDDVVGRVVRTRPGTRPLVVSVGHRCDLGSAVAAVLACRTRFRLPEPTRQADRLVAQAKRGTFPDVVTCDTVPA